MAFLNPPKEEDLFRYESVDGYDQGGLIYFRFEGKEMVAVVRERSVLKKHVANNSTLNSYLNSLVTTEAYGAALLLEKMIPVKPLPSRKD